MATNHHHQCHCTPTPTTATTTCYCTMCYTTTHHPQPLPIHSISSSHKHHHYQHAPPQTHHSQHYNSYNSPQTHQDHHFFENPPSQPLNPTVSSLIHRIAALESSLLLRRRSSNKHSPTLRDAAARTIQTHFRAFLVRRSAILRHLKHLAHIKSALNRLKSSLSNKTHLVSHKTLSRESMTLLINLDSIQGSDPMIRDGKRSISRELIRFMELIEEMCTDREVMTVKNVRCVKPSKKSLILQPENVKIQRKYVSQVGQSFNFENPRKPSVCQIRIGDLTKSQSKSQPKVKKNVKFDVDGNVYRLFKSGNHNHVSSDGSDASNGDGDEEVEVEVEEIGVSSKETEVGDDDSSEMSENEMDPRKNLRTRIHHTTKKSPPEQEDEEDDDDEEEDSFVFSAPLPAKMEY